MADTHTGSAGERFPDRLAPALPDCTGRRVLLVEDSAVNAALAAELLGMAGADVDHAENGAAALERFHSAVASIGAAKAEIYPRVSLGGSFAFAATGTRAAFASSSTGRSSSPREMWSGLRVSTSRRSAPACVVRVHAVKAALVIGSVPFRPFGQ